MVTGRLSTENLEQLSPDVPHPGYDRSALQVGIVHFGVGGFHRSHQAMFLDQLMSQGVALDWGICGVGTLPADRTTAERMTAQDCLYTLLAKHADGTIEPRVVGSIVEYLLAPDDPHAVIERMTDPKVRIVSLTVTEGGYFIDSDGGFDPLNEAVQQDLAHPKEPRTVFGMIATALSLRRERGVPAFTVMSCDNIPNNGNVTRNSVLGVTAPHDPDLAEWIAAEVSFPSSMVDRITPATTDADRATAVATTGLSDECPVVCEPFAQWVLEDDFPLGRPPFEDVGVQLVPDVWPYELMKLRLLNATHQCMAYFGYLAGYHYTHEAAADELIAELLRRYMDEEATPTLPPVPGVDLQDYKRSLLERYRNPQIRDTLARLCAESSDRIPKFLLPVIRQRLTAGARAPLACAVVASWARYDEGVDESGAPIDVVDALRDDLIARAQRQRQQPTAFVENPGLFGQLTQSESFVADYLLALTLLQDRGALATLRELLALDRQPRGTSSDSAPI